MPAADLFFDVALEAFAPEIHKRCPKCGDTKPLSEFHRNTGHRLGVTSWCKLCSCAHTQAWNVKNVEYMRGVRRAKVERRTDADRDKFNRNQKLWQYGLSDAELTALEAAHTGRCALCGRSAKRRSHERHAVLHLDHQHLAGGKDGPVRGLLCFSCNTKIAVFDESPEYLERVRRYLAWDLPQQVVKPRMEMA